MKETEFVELVNLYIDREISSDELALLEREIHRSPDRRRLFQQYCRMHRGCLELALQFHAAGSTGQVEPQQLIQPREDRRSWRARGLYATGALAACVALVIFVREPGNSHQPALAMNQPVPERTERLAVGDRRLPDPAADQKRQELQPVFVASALSLDGTVRDAEFILTSSNQTQFDWMSQVDVGLLRHQVPPDELVFAVSKPVQPDQRIFRSNRPFQNPVESTAFRFQR